MPSTASMRKNFIICITDKDLEEVSRFHILSV